MTKVDDQILEWLDSRDLTAVPPKTIWIDLPEGERASYSQVNRRLRKLHDAGLVGKHPEAATHYQLTELGEKYLHDPDASVEDFLPDEDNEEDESGDGES